MDRIFVTGTAGFIGFHLARRLLAQGREVHGYDAMTPYYDSGLKQARLEQLRARSGYVHHQALLEDLPALQAALRACRPQAIVHLAAQAGVRYSLENPRAYVDANLVGAFNLLECAREQPLHHLLFASTSSVYGAATQMPFRETQASDQPLTLYAATKKAGEVMAHAYAHLWGLPTTLFRFFTVYGPWGRPDMAPYKFIRAILAGEPIEVYNHGDLQRDFTYIDDLIEAILRLLEQPPAPPAGRPDPAIAGDSLSPVAPQRIVNIGNARPVRLPEFIAAIEQATGKTAIQRLLPMQPGDAPATWADTTLLEALTGFKPSVDVREGVARTVEWFRSWQQG